MSETQTMLGQVVDKVSHYKWTVKDVPGVLQNLSKTVLQVHASYQRHASDARITAIASKWSWVACGTIIVGKRGGEYWVIDGQHRVLAAKRRSDIKTLPCLVFKTDSVAQEAQGFLEANTGRKPVMTIEKYRAGLAANDPTYTKMFDMFKRLNINVRVTINGARDFKSIAWAVQRMKDDPVALERVLGKAIAVCGKHPLSEKVVASMFYIHKNTESGLDDVRLMKKLTKMGGEGIVNAANKAAAYFASGGVRIWADGVLNEVNKGLHTKIALNNSQETTEE